MILFAFLAQTLRIAIPYLFAASGGVVSERSGLIAKHNTWEIRKDFSLLNAGDEAFDNGLTFTQHHSVGSVGD